MAALPPDMLLVTARLITAGLFAVCVVGILMAINIVTGRRQRREGSGTWTRLIAVAAAVAGLQLAPAVLGLLLWWFDPRWAGEQQLLAATFLLTILNAMFLLPAMGPTVRFYHSKEPLPLVTDESLLARVAELATQMKLPTPVVRLLPTAGGELQAQAFAGGLVAPSLVVGDGILHRLSPDERDATIAHELAHIANGSLWWLTAAVPIAMSAGVLVGSFTSLGLALAFAFTCWIGVRNLISRHFEYDCDRRAAEVLGYRTTHSALSKIHAANPLRDGGWFSYILFATATHPSRAERLAAVHDAAPPEELQVMPNTAADVRRRRLAGWVAVICWLGTLIGVPWWSSRLPDSSLPIAMLTTVGLVPWLAIILESRRATRDARRRMIQKQSRSKWTLWMALLIATAMVFGILQSGFPLEDSLESGELPLRMFIFVLLFVFIGVLLLLLIRGMLTGETNIAQKVAIAMQTRDFERVFELAEAHPRAFQKSAVLRHNLGFAAAMAGQREWAEKILDALRQDEPRFTESVLVLALMHLDEGRPEAALPLIEEVQDKLPDDPTPLLLRGRVLRQLDRLDEAQKCIDRALELKPDSGNTFAVSAWIACDRCDHERARELLVAAEQHEPGTAFIEYVKAQVSLAVGDGDAARKQIERAITASDANPYALLQNQVRELAERNPSA